MRVDQSRHSNLTFAELGNTIAKICGLRCNWPPCPGWCARQLGHHHRPPGPVQHVCCRCGTIIPVGEMFQEWGESVDGSSSEDWPKSGTGTFGPDEIPGILRRMVGTGRQPQEFAVCCFEEGGVICGREAMVAPWNKCHRPGCRHYMCQEHRCGCPMFGPRCCVHCVDSAWYRRLNQDRRDAAGRNASTYHPGCK